MSNYFYDMSKCKTEVTLLNLKLVIALQHGRKISKNYVTYITIAFAWFDEFISFTR